jgi:predicted metal-binding protein
VLSDEKIDNFVEVFRNAAKESNDEILKNKLTQSVTLLEQIQHLEHEDKIQDEKDIKELEKMLEQL